MSPASDLRELDLLRRQVADLARELTERDQALREQHRQFDDELVGLREQSDMLRAIVAGTATETGEDFFQTLVFHLCSVLGVQYAVAGEVQQGPITKIRTIAVSAGGIPVDNFEYPLVNTPCKTAFEGSFVCFERDVRRSFPAFERLATLGVESYCGIPLRAKSGAILGLLAIMDTKPLQNTERLKSLMTVFASRAGAELQRRQAEQKLDQQQRHFVEAQALAHLGSWDWDIDSGKVQWSEELFRMFGYEPGAIAVTYDTFLNTLHPEDHDRVRGAVNEVLDGRASYDLECRIVRQDGEIRIIHCRGEVLRDNKDRPVSMAGSALDITDRKRVEEAVRESEERYRTLIELSPSGVFVFSEGRTAYVNHAGAALLGAKDAQEILDRPTFEFIHPDYHHDVRENVKRLLGGGMSVNSAERMYLKMDGTSIPVQVEAARITWNGKPAILGLFSDITERKEAERALWKSRQAIRALHDISSAQGHSFKERVEALLQLGCRFFDLPIGMETFVRGDELEVGQVNAPGMPFQPGMRVALSTTYCGEALRQSGPLCFAHAGADPEWQQHPAYAALKLESYIGTVINGQERTYGTLCFTSIEPRRKPFTDSERDFIQLMARWLGGELDRQAALDDLRQSEERYRTLYDETPSMYFTVDGTGIIRSVNQYGAQYLGYRVEDLVGKSVAVILFEADRARICAEMDAFFRHPEGVAQWEFRKVRADGAVLWVREVARVLQRRDGDSLALIVCEDITERKRAEEALRGSEERYGRATAIGKVGVWEMDLETSQYYYGEPHLKALFGYVPDELSPEPDAWLNLVYPDDRPIALNHWEQMRNGMVDMCHFELRMVKKDGSLIWIDVRCHGVRDQSGRVTRLIGAAVDITERKQAEEALRESEERFAKAFRTSPHPIGITEVATGRCIEVNDACLELFGYQREEVIGNTTLLLGIWPNPDDRRRVIERLKAGQPVRNMEFALRIKSGAVRYLLASADLAELNGTPCIVTVANDITDRKHAEEALRLSEERYARATAVGKVGVWELDVINGQYHGDANLKALFGYGADELSADPFVWLRLVHPDDQSIAMKNWELVQSGAADASHYELRHRKKDGSIVWGDVRARAVRDQDGQLTHLIGATVDITERKQAEEALRVSEERFAKAFRASPHPVVISELDSGRVVEANEAAYQLLGYGKDEVEGHTTLQIGLWHSVEERASYLERLRREGSVHNVEVKLRSRNGEVRQCLLSSELIELNGRPCSVTVGDDITESKRAEEALRASEERLRSIFENAGTGIAFADAEGRHIQCNPAYCAIVGYSEEELRRTTFRQLIHPDDHARNFELVEQLVSHAIPSFEIENRYVHKDGRAVLVHKFVTALRGDDGRLTHFIALVTDISERKRAEEELRNSHTFLRQVIDTDPNFIFAKDREGRFTLVNKAIADCYGSTVEDLIGKSDADFNPNAEEVEFFRQNDLEVMNFAQERFIPEETITDSAGKPRWLQTVKRPIFDDLGGVHMVLGAATDITERKRMEEMLLQRERDLNAALHERERISQDLHDGILQSLYAVGLGLEVCKPLIKTQQDHGAGKFMASLDQAIGQLNQVMAEVRNFIAGLESQVMQGGDFSVALRTMVETMSTSSSARCRVRIDEAVAQRMSTEQALHIINIVREGLSNALRHSRAKRITVSLRGLVRSVRLTITDDGIGFNARAAQGVGHGLSNMAARAQRVRGSFAIQSKPWKGTKILLDLPKDGHHAHN